MKFHTKKQIGNVFFQKDSAIDNSNEFSLFKKGDGPTRCDQGDIYGNSKTIDVTGVICDLNLEVDTKLGSKQFCH